MSYKPSKNHPWNIISRSETLISARRKNKGAMRMQEASNKAKILKEARKLAAKRRAATYREENKEWLNGLKRAKYSHSCCGHNKSQCYEGNGGYICTREYGHKGKHIACGTSVHRQFVWSTK